MTNEELKKKICEIIDSSCSFYCGSNVHMDDEQENDIADALIAAGIGDVKDVEAEANRYEMLYKLQNRDMALAERREHDAEHRAKVAERALNKFAENVTCEDCPFFSDCSSLEKMKDSVHQNYCYAEYLRQAEKELAEERK